MYKYDVIIWSKKKTVKYTHQNLVSCKYLIRLFIFVPLLCIVHISYQNKVKWRSTKIYLMKKITTKPTTNIVREKNSSFVSSSSGPTPTHPSFVFHIFICDGWNNNLFSSLYYCICVCVCIFSVIWVSF